MLIRNCDGFTLLEVMFAFSLFIFFSIGTLPLLTTIYKERITIEEEVAVLYELEEVVHRYQHGLPIKNHAHEIDHININEHIIQFCMKWSGTNGRDYEHCLLSAK